MTSPAVATALVAAIVALAACASWQTEACAAFRTLNEDIQLEDPEDAATANVAIAERIAARLSGARWPGGETAQDALRDAASAAATGARAYLRGDFERWTDDTGTHLIELDKADRALKGLGVDCGTPLRYPVPTSVGAALGAPGP